MPVRARIAASDVRAVAGHPRPAVPTAAIARAPCRLASSTIPAMAGRRALDRLGAEIVPVCVEPLAEAGDLGAVGDGRQRAVRATLGEVELHRVRADVDDGVPRGRVVEERR